MLASRPGYFTTGAERAWHKPGPKHVLQSASNQAVGALRIVTLSIV
jgi:hypothetical protein